MEATTTIDDRLDDNHNHVYSTNNDDNDVYSTDDDDDDNDYDKDNDKEKDPPPDCSQTPPQKAADRFSIFSRPQPRSSCALAIRARPKTWFLGQVLLNQQVLIEDGENVRWVVYEN